MARPPGSNGGGARVALWAILAAIFVVVALLSQRAELVVLRDRLVECSQPQEETPYSRRSGALIEESPVVPEASPSSPAPLPATAPPRVLMVTAEPPSECSTATAQWLGSRAMRNRVVYAQRQGWCVRNAQRLQAQHSRIRVQAAVLVHEHCGPVLPWHRRERNVEQARAAG